MIKMMYLLDKENMVPALLEQEDLKKYECKIPVSISK